MTAGGNQAAGHHPSSFSSSGFILFLWISKPSVSLHHLCKTQASPPGLFWGGQQLPPCWSSHASLPAPCPQPPPSTQRDRVINLMVSHQWAQLSKTSCRKNRIWIPHFSREAPRSIAQPLYSSHTGHKALYLFPRGRIPLHFTPLLLDHSSATRLLLHESPSRPLSSPRTVFFSFSAHFPLCN